MALSEHERRYLDELADELAAELTCTDPGLVHALAHDLIPGRPAGRILIQVLLVVSLPLAVVAIGLNEPIVFAAACLSLVAAGLVAVSSRLRRRFGTGT